MFHKAPTRQWLSAAVLLTAALSLATPQQPGKGAIQGQVRRADTNSPVAGVTVRAYVGDAIDRPAKVTTTNREGGFSMTGMDPATYTLRFEHESYVVEFLGEKRIPGGMSLKEVTVRADQTVRNVIMLLTPTGSVSGRVVDNNGQPLSGIPVWLLSHAYSPDGKQQFTPIGGEKFQTNDRGEYRLFGLEPGRYYISAGRGPRVTEGGEVFGLTYYPNAARIGDAEAINVRSGSDLAGINFQLRRTRGYQVRGRVLDEETGRPPQHAFITANLSNMLVPLSIGGGKYDPGTGGFEIGNLLPGEHSIGAQVSGGPCDAARSIGTGVTFISPEGPPSLEAGGSTTVRITSADVEGVVVTIRSAGCLTGSVRTDGARLPGFWFRMASVRDESFELGAQEMRNGAFEVDGLLPGEYRISMFAPPRGFYMKTATFGGADVLGGYLNFDGSSATRLEILLSSNVAQIEGRVTDEKSQPASNMYVVLVPDKMRARTELYATTVTGEDGRFTLPSLAPGDYKVFAWEDIEPYSWFDPAVLRQYESRGKAIRLEESSRESIELTLIKP